MKIAVLTSPDQWFIPYAEKLVYDLPNAKLFCEHESIDKSFDLVLILSYHRIITQKYLSLHKHNIVIHASDLPKGKGWSPMFWQIVEGKNEIPFSMFEADQGIDSGNIYLKKFMQLNGYELNKELRDKQAKFIINMCIDFINNYDAYKNATPQESEESQYSKRTPENSKLDINKTINEQFNLLRIVDNDEYPAFFYLDKKKYVIKIYEG